MDPVRKNEKPFDLDDVLVNEIGQFGRFQLFTMVILAVPLIMTGFLAEYIFSTAAIPHRCMIPECGENSKDMAFDNWWITSAIPETSSGTSSCQRYQPLGNNGTLTSCPATLFNQLAPVDCEDGYVYEREGSVVYDFDLGCQELMRTLSGTIASIGNLVCLPFIGFISDRYGRRMALIVNAFNISVLGVARAFSTSYPMFLTLQFFQSAFGSGFFVTSYICVTELVGPKYRVIAGVTCSAMFATGQVLVGLIAWSLDSWRHLILALYSPCIVIVGYYWLMPESVRWMLSKKKYEEATVLLKKVARMNRKELSEKSLQALTNPVISDLDNETKPSLLAAIRKSPVLLRRLCTTPYWWVATTFVYYGMSINSVSLSDSPYLNFILISAVEIPGFYSGFLLLDRIGRRPTLSGGYFLCTACCVAFILIPTDLVTVRLIMYLLGKFGISLVMTSLYLYTAELYPTEYRHSFIAFSGMVGRIGSITAPLTPALIDTWSGFPSLLFSVAAFFAGLLVLTQPETLGTKMPDTLEEAEAIGKK